MIWEDPQIPKRDKQIIGVLLILILSPWDLIPESRPFWGKVDDLFYIAIILDYGFRVLDSRIVLSHWPWGMTSFARVRAIARFLGSFLPSFLLKYVWKFKPDPYD
jgi:uncharacterized membrane protein YkvA (DUF1232 family)